MQWSTKLFLQGVEKDRSFAEFYLPYFLLREVTLVIVLFALKEVQWVQITAICTNQGAFLVYMCKTTPLENSKSS